MPVVGGEDLGWLAMHVARLGFETEILEPPELREAAALLARRLAAMAGTG
ncbi:WYL domain-containing protein [Sphaerisporangium sp. NPDC051017]